jgi:peptidoglycan/xylan/chitin deacetylase (PgdA/CDA1 family)
MITGLAENAGYLSWGQINEMAGGGIYFGNHTWSHHNMKAVLDVITKEVGTAEQQLQDHGLNASKVFAYPYGLMSPLAINYLSTNGYNMAFDTISGRIQCAKKKFELTRIRVGNSRFPAYGL